jgi:hypothetical protein
MTAAGDPDVLMRPVGFGQVVIVTGHVTDAPTRKDSRFPEAAVPAVSVRIAQTLESWRFGAGDLLISGAARGADLLAAAIARDLRATVWLLLAEPPDEFEQHSVVGAADAWVERFRALVAELPLWVLPNGRRHTDDPNAVYVATIEWMLRVALAQADGRPLRVLAVWDGRAAAGPGGAGDMVDAARRLGTEVTIIDPAG